MARLLVFLVSLGVRALRAICRSRADLVIENLALHQQVAALIKQRPRPALDDADRAFWVALRAAWPRWVNGLVIVKADTVAKRMHQTEDPSRRGPPPQRRLSRCRALVDFTIAMRGARQREEAFFRLLATLVFELSATPDG
jgi:hypothetical protein